MCNNMDNENAAGIVVDRSLKISFIVAITVYITYITLSIMSYRGFYGDGSFAYFSTLQNPNNILPTWNDPSVYRICTDFILGLPLSAALKLGIQSDIALKILFNIPLFCVNIVGLFICYNILKSKGKKHYFSFILANYSMFMIVSEMFIVNQTFLSTWLYFIIFLYCLTDEKPKKIEIIFLTVIFALCVQSHDTIWLFFLLDLVIVIYNLYIKKTKNISFNYFLLIGICLNFALFILFLFNRTATPLTQTDYIKQIFNAIFELLNINLGYSLVGGLTILCVLLGGKKLLNMDKRFEKNLVAIFISIFFILFVLCLIRFRTHVNPIMEYTLRGYITVGTFGFMVLMFIFHIFNLYKYINAKLITFIALLILIVQTTWQIENTIRWSAMCERSKQSLQQSEGGQLDAYQDVFTQGTAQLYLWGWTDPVFSIIIQENRDIDTVFLSQFNMNDWSIDENGELLLWGVPRLYSSYYNFSALTEALKSK